MPQNSGTKELIASTASVRVREASVIAGGENATGGLICIHRNKEEVSSGRWCKQTWFSTERVPPGSGGCFKETDAGTCRM